MDRWSLQQYLVTIREILDEPWEVPAHCLTLGQQKEITREELEQEKTCSPPEDPLADAAWMIISQARYYNLTGVIRGLDELLKAYMRKITAEKQVPLTESVSEKLEELFIYLSDSDFPFPEKIWNWLSAASKPVGLFLITNGYLPAAFLFAEFLARLGRRASAQDLGTGGLQHLFRILELRAEDQGLFELKLRVKNLRHNLEI